MCGIAGYFGRKKISKSEIFSTLKIMRNRGPDFSNFYQKQINDNLSVTLLHSRLSIIDINNRSNQPFEDDNNIVIFNGEIYNFIELRKFLIERGEKFTTESDTEVLLKYYKIYKENCVQYFEGMWAFAIYDKKNKKIFLSRDRFAEKPLYYFVDSNGIFFGSEIKFLQKLSNSEFQINDLHLNNFLSLGYKSLFKGSDTFFKNVNFLCGSENLICDKNLKIEKKTYWKPLIKKNIKISIEDAIDEAKTLLHKSLKLRIRSDVPIAICLSGGVDSSGLLSILSKEFNYNAKTFSIIDQDDRYDESFNIKKTLYDTKCENISISLGKKNFLKNLKDQIVYHNAPVATISYHVHSLLAKSMNENNYKVAICGTAADEIYTGYYDHFLQHLQSCRNSKFYEKSLSNWEKYIKKFIRNSDFLNPNLYINNPNYREHIYDGRAKISYFLKNENKLNFKEEHYDDDLLTNRRLNELFKENTPLILNQEDLNFMKYSIENRSPYLDTNLFNFIFSLPNEYLIKDGYGKYILRQSLKGTLNETVRLDRMKKGFNASINTLVDFNDKETTEYLLDKKSKIFDFVDRDRISDIFNGDKTANVISKFLFSFISSKIFLDLQN